MKLVKSKKHMLIYAILWLGIFSLEGQVATEIDGSIQISNSDDVTSEPGTIRFNSDNNDFEGWNGYFWTSLTGFQTDTISDIDGNIYKTAMIGDEEWMIENLKTSRYREGTPILHADDNATWSTNTTGAYTYLHNSIANDSIYGKLYNWYAVATEQLCPSGWKVPFEADWDRLTDYLGGDEDIAGNYLKEVGTQHWNSSSDDVTNSSGFTSIGGGSRSPAGTSWEAERAYANYWALTVATVGSSPEGAFARKLYSFNSGFITFVAEKNRGYSVRCIKE